MALDGIIQSAWLWYLEISQTLIDLDFFRNKMDDCVFNVIKKWGADKTLCGFDEATVDYNYDLCWI